MGSKAQEYRVHNDYSYESHVQSHRPDCCDTLPLEVEAVLATAVALVYQIARGVVHLCRFLLRHLQRDTQTRGALCGDCLQRKYGSPSAALDVVQIM
jgi:hypothetical protein